MNTSVAIAAFIAGALISTHARASTLVVDDFSVGSFFLSRGGTTSYSDALVTPLTDQRVVTGVGFPAWTTTLSSGELVYMVASPSPGRNYLTLDYSVSSGAFSILGYSAFAVDVSNLVGTGEFVVSVSGSGGGEIPVTISGDGTILFPFSNLDTSQPLDSLVGIVYEFRPLTEDFSATIDNVRLIPEPSMSLLLLIGLGSGVMRRRRKN